jgi:hypothetical protein
MPTGQALNGFLSLEPDMEPESQKKITDNIHTNVLLLIALGAGALASSYIEMSCWMISGENQTKVRGAIFQTYLLFKYQTFFLRE